MQLSDAQLLAYIEGEAGPLVVRAIDRSPELQARVDALRADRRSLTSALFRQSCPDADTLGDLYLGLLDRAETRHVEQHVAHCRYCAREIVQYRLFVGAPAKKASLVDRLKIWLTQTAGNTGPDLVPALALRGAEQVQLFEAEDIQISIDIQPSPGKPDQRALVGIVVGSLPADLTVDLWRDDNHQVTTAADEIGTFAVDYLTPGTYDLILRGEQTLIHLPAVEV